jgi:hypothetical protein
VNNIFFTIVFGVTDLLGLPANTYFDGLDLLQFWK